MNYMNELRLGIPTDTPVIDDIVVWQALGKNFFVLTPEQYAEVKPMVRHWHMSLFKSKKDDIVLSLFTDGFDARFDEVFKKVFYDKYDSRLR